MQNLNNEDNTGMVNVTVDSVLMKLRYFYFVNYGSEVRK